MTIKLTSTSPDETYNLGLTLGKCLKGTELLLLHGDLGAGKTLLTKGIAETLNIDAEEVVSPTYTLMNRFDGHFPLFHLDLYRLGNAIKGNLPEIDDYLNEGIIIIEWAQFLDTSYARLSNTININIHVEDEDTRKIEIETRLTYVNT